MKQCACCLFCSITLSCLPPHACMGRFRLCLLAAEQLTIVLYFTALSALARRESRLPGDRCETKASVPCIRRIRPKQYNVWNTVGCMHTLYSLSLPDCFWAQGLPLRDLTAPTFPALCFLSHGWSPLAAVDANLEASVFGKGDLPLFNPICMQYAVWYSQAIWSHAGSRAEAYNSSRHCVQPSPSISAQY